MRAPTPDGQRLDHRCPVRRDPSGASHAPTLTPQLCAHCPPGQKKPAPGPQEPGAGQGENGPQCYRDDVTHGCAQLRPAGRVGCRRAPMRFLPAWFLVMEWTPHPATVRLFVTWEPGRPC